VLYCPNDLVMNWNDVIRMARTGSPEPDRRIDKTAEEWAQLLSVDQFRVARQKGTERPWSGAYCEAHEPGIYACVCCGTKLFDSTSKFDSGTGWPSFTEPIARNALRYEVDLSFGMQRVEVLCNACDAHLGHVFPDGPAPDGLRFCINSVSLLKIN
jgi:methionine-R-sulfoxide reductase